MPIELSVSEGLSYMRTDNASLTLEGRSTATLLPL
jgi:hypothetical protein